MANSEYGYVRNFEHDDRLLPNTWLVIRIDGRSFHKFSTKYDFEKPNDARALLLMNNAAREVLDQLPDVSLAYGQSDEYSFVLHPCCTLYERRSAKLVSTIVSTFTAAYVIEWRQLFNEPLTPPFPSFDGRSVIYPTLKNLRDYLAWRQVDCHINNLYNTTFWALVEQGGMGRTEAEQSLKGTLAADKNEILWTRFGINYNELLAIYRKGTVLFRNYKMDDYDEEQQSNQDIVSSNRSAPRSASRALKLHAYTGMESVDIIKDDFWNAHPWLLEHGSAKKRAARAFFETQTDST